MTETYKMWRLMRLLKEKRYDWAKTKYEAKEGESDEERNFRLIRQIFEAVHTHEVEVSRTRLIIEYLNKYGKIPKDKDGKWDRAQSKTHIGIVTSLVESCVEKGLLIYKKDETTSDEYICITLNGKKFTEITGLLKEWIEEDIGVLWSIIISITSTAVGVIGALRWDWIVKFSGIISPWW